MALKTIRITINIPGEAEELLEKRVKEERYPSLSAYFNGLFLFDLYARRPHLLTASLMREPQWVRDQVVSELVRDFDKEETHPKGWFEIRIEELIAERKAKGEESAS